ncbi:PREDICTED: uncharacterized protein LOC109584478 isoform X2 [Amphimedon queenslandica]|uniref:Uncharacterized protein n=1 Tax=Amphimedon queenslandica TaxID=400682 RepID=A0AAN0JFQ8_AMPQE|nr:PREDICTED: uncharacterized protein LOC109584478 isoform X2 [Amphimedon queenslandica]|eukprot:XP_019855789.1 PREDICTED: uncharacterized protein LOC109584478 isoform X2 [Amphimedon queenslandica]
MNCISYSGYSGAYKCVHNDDNKTLKFELDVPTTMVISTITSTMPCSINSLHEVTTCSNFLYTSMLQHESIASSLSFASPSSSMISPVQSSSTVPHYAGIGLLVATNLLTIIALISSCVYIFCQRKKSKFIVTENEQIPLQNTSPQTEATSHNTETSPTSNNNANITSGTNIYSSVEDEVDHHHHHHRPPARVASQYEVPLDLLQQAHVPLPPPPPLYATLDDQHDLTLPNPEYITNTAVTAPNPGYITNITPKANPGYSSTAIKEGEGERERREELDYSYATVNKFLKKPTEDTEYNKLQHE